jgi:hypothetical protein
MTWRDLYQGIRRRMKRRLQNWPHFLNNFTNRRLSQHVRENEQLTTFVLHHSRVNRVTGRVREEQFLPRPGKGNPFETSINRTTCLARSTIWKICRDHFEKPAKHARGRGCGPASAVFAQNLTFDADGVPHPSHANIIGWYIDPAKTVKEMQKHHWKIVAQKIAAKFPYLERPN